MILVRLITNTIALLLALFLYRICLNFRFPLDILAVTVVSVAVLATCRET